MQSAAAISTIGELELGQNRTGNAILVGSSISILNTLRFIGVNERKPVTVFAPEARVDLELFCDANKHINLVKEDFAADFLGRKGRIMIVQEYLLEPVIFFEDETGVYSRVKQFLNKGSSNEEKKWKGVATKLIIAFALMVLGHIIIPYLPLPSFSQVLENLRPYFDQQFLFFILTGFLAQMVDGVLSMGYGVTSATCLMSFGMSPVSVSAAIHTSEIFTSGISGYSHYKFGNVNKKMFRALVVPGVVGAILGALLLVFLGEKAGNLLMPLVAIYAMFLGLKILIKAFSINQKKQKVKRIGWLAGAGGFLDSFGGGGWGPIVTSTLVAKGKNPKYTVGSVSLTEFFITLASATTFFMTVGVSHWNVVLGLLIGGAIAAPFAAKLAGMLPRKMMMIAVGIMVMIWCLRMIIKSVL